MIKRNIRVSAIIVFGLIGLFLTACTAARGPVFDESSAQWAQYESPNFTLISDVSFDDAQSLLTDLEDFRTFVRAQLSPVGGLRPRLTIVAPTKRDGFAAFGDPDDLGGLYFRTIDTDFLIINLSITEEYNRGSNGFFQAIDVLKHEYTHAVVADMAGNPLPRWLNEGYAEYFSTAGRDGDDFIIGEPLRRRVADLRRVGSRPVNALRSIVSEGGGVRSREFLPLETVLEARRRNVFDRRVVLETNYNAHAWLVFHSLYRNEMGRSELRTYLEARDKTDEEVAPFEYATGQDVAEYDSEIWRHIPSRNFPVQRVPAPPQLDVDVTEVGPVSEADFWCNVGRFRGFFADADEAKRIFRRALETDPDNVCALSHLSKLESWDERFDIAERLVQRAEALGGDDPFTPLARAMIFFNRFRIAEDQSTFERAEINRGLAQIQEAIKADPSIALSHWMYATVIAIDKKSTHADNLRALVAINEAERLQPQDKLVLSWVKAALLESMGHLSEAEETYRFLAQWDRDTDRRNRARKILELFAVERSAEKVVMPEPNNR